MKIAIRTDASLKIGTGHVMRCLSLAQTLRDHGAEIFFISRDLEGQISGVIEGKGFHCFRLPTPISPLSKQESFYLNWLEVGVEQDVTETMAALDSIGKMDWLVTDHYALGEEWETSLKGNTRKIMVIDDLFNRNHSCDLLLNQNIISHDFNKYRGLVPENSRILMGPRYSLLRKEFAKAHNQLKIEKRTGDIKRILISFGGSDKSNETLKTLQALRELPNFEINIVIGASNPHKEQLESFIADMPKAALYVQTEKMVELMAEADLAIGASGTTSWERCCLALPTLALVVAENQLAIADELHQHGAIYNLGRAENVTAKEMRNTFKTFLGKPRELKIMAEKAFSLVDGLGSKRVLHILEEIA